MKDEMMNNGRLVSEVAVEDNVKDTIIDVSERLKQVDYNPMILHGEAAHTAKFLTELGAYEAEETANWNIREVTGEQLVKDYTDSVTYGHVADYMESFVKLDRLVVTNFDYVLEKADVLEQRFVVRLFDGLIFKMRQVIVTIEDDVIAYEANAIPELIDLLSKATEVGVK